MPGKGAWLSMKNELLTDRAFVERVFREAYEIGLSSASRGTVASYIPELNKADPKAFGMYMMTDDFCYGVDFWRAGKFV